MFYSTHHFCLLINYRWRLTFTTSMMEFTAASTACCTITLKLLRCFWNPVPVQTTVARSGARLAMAWIASLPTLAYHLWMSAIGSFLRTWGLTPWRLLDALTASPCLKFSRLFSRTLGSTSRNALLTPNPISWWDLHLRCLLLTCYQRAAARLLDWCPLPFLRLRSSLWLIRKIHRMPSPLPQTVNSRMGLTAILLTIFWLTFFKLHRWCNSSTIDQFIFHPPPGLHFFLPPAKTNCSCFSSPFTPPLNLF